MLTCSSLGNQSRLKALRCFFVRLFSLIVSTRCHAARSKPARAFCSAEDIEQLPFTVVGTARWLSKSCTNTNTKTKTVTPNKNTQTHKRKYPNTTLHSCWHHLSYTESEKPRQRVSNADRKVFANPESFCDKFIIGWRISGYMQNVRMNWKVSGQS